MKKLEKSDLKQSCAYFLSILYQRSLKCVDESEHYFVENLFFREKLKTQTLSNNEAFCLIYIENI